MKRTPHPDARSSVRRVLACAGLFATVLGAPACSTSSKPSGTHPTTTTTDQNAPAPSRVGTTLRKQAERELRRPVPSAQAAPPPPGVDAAAISPIAAPDLAHARTPTPQAIAAVASLLPDPRPVAPREIDEATKLEALKAYVAGRAARLDGNLTLAKEELERSAKLNPNPPEPWREIAEIYLELGDRHGAEQSFQRSFERDPTDPRVLERTALLPSDGDTSDAVAGALARLNAIPPDQLDPAMRYLVPAGLGRVLMDRGYIAAGVEMLTRAADLPSSFSESTNFREELSDLYRRRGEVFRDAGDGLMRLGEVQEALALYERASMLPLLDPDALLGRRVAALMVLGRPSQASLAVIDSISRRGGLIRDGHVVLLRAIAESSDTGPAIVEALREDEALATPEAARASRPLRIQAIASVLPPDQGRAYLREQVVDAGGNAGLLADLYALALADGDEAVIQESILLTSLDPFGVDRFVNGMLPLASNIPQTLSVIETASLPPGATEPARSLVRARVLTILGRFSEALAALESPSGTDDERRAVTLARIRVLAAMGRFDEARAELLAFDPGERAASIVGKAALLANQDKAAEALALLESVARSPGARDWERADAHLTAASILTGEGRYADAAEELRTVLALDPTNENAHAGLIAMYMPNGPLASEAKLVEALRSLRDNAPDSKTFRMLRARDSIARGRPDLAERDLIALATDYPDDPTIIELLITTWVEQDRAPEAEAWLRERLTRMPGNRTDTVELAKVLVRTDRAREGADLLAEWLARSPADAGVSRSLESIYRDELHDPEYASRLAAERIARTPVSVDTLGETAVLNLQDLRIGPAAEAVHAMVDLSVATGRPVGKWSELIAAPIAQLVNDQLISAAQAGQMLSDLAERAPDAPESVHLLRVQVLGRSNVPVADMISAAELASQKFPGLRDRAFYALMDQLRFARVLETPRMPTQVGMVNQQQPVRRPIDARQAERDELERVSSRNAMAFTVANHLRSTRPDPPAATVDAYAIDAAARSIRSGRDALLTEFAQVIDEVLARPDRDEVFNLAARLTFEAANDGDAGNPNLERRAIVVSNLSDVFNTAGDDDRADVLSRLALTYDPRNVTANNNFGYRLLQRNLNLDEAIAMIEIAYRQEPDAPHIIDSMAWALYKIGVVHDELDAEGNATRLGAVSLLNRALRTMEQDNQMTLIVNRPILLDHLGDAQWAAGDHQGAEASWREALRTGEAVLPLEERARLSSYFDESVFDEIEAAVLVMRSKIGAVEAGTEPPISPILRPVNAPSPARTIDDKDNPSPSPESTAPPDPSAPAADPPPAEEPEPAPQFESFR